MKIIHDTVDYWILISLQLDDVLRNGDILTYEVYRGFLRMDGQTLVNLEIFSNSADGGPSGKFLYSLVIISSKTDTTKLIFVILNELLKACSLV